MSDDLYLVIRHSGVFDRIHRIMAAETLIGRAERSAVHLPDPAVSRTHAVLLRTDSGFLIRDLGSRNGTLLEGSPTNEGVLREGMTVEIGPYCLMAFLQRATAVQAAAAGSEESTRSKRDSAFIHGEVEDSAQQLTLAQRRVYERFREGRSEKEVAALLRISIHTVHHHAKAIYKLFSVSSRAELLTRGSLPLDRTNQ